MLTGVRGNEKYECNTKCLECSLFLLNVGFHSLYHFALSINAFQRMNGSAHWDLFCICYDMQSECIGRVVLIVT